MTSIRRSAMPIRVHQLWDAIGHSSAADVMHFENLLSVVTSMYKVPRDELNHELIYAMKDKLVVTEIVETQRREETEIYKLPNHKTIERGDHDWYCFQCHLGGSVVKCEDCPRVFHLECLPEDRKPDKDLFVCPPCHIMSTKPSAERVGLKQKPLNQLIEYICERFKTWSASFLETANGKTWAEATQRTEKDAWRYAAMVFLPIDLTRDVFRGVIRELFETFTVKSTSLMDNKNRKIRYVSLEEFQVDCETLVHAMGVYFGVDMLKGSQLGAAFIREAMHDIQEIKLCHECFRRSNEKNHEWWFCLPCTPQHEIVWAKQTGYPYWPAKVMKKEGNKYDVRYFGGNYERGIIDAKNIQPIETAITQLKIRRTAAWNDAYDELQKFEEIGLNPELVSTLPARGKAGSASTSAKKEGTEEVWCLGEFNPSKRPSQSSRGKIPCETICLDDSDTEEVQEIKSSVSLHPINMDVDYVGVSKAGGDILGNNVHMKTEGEDENVTPTGSAIRLSGRSAESDEPEIIGIKSRKRPAAGEPECIDLTHEDENDEDEDMGSEFDIEDEDELEELPRQEDEDMGSEFDIEDEDELEELPRQEDEDMGSEFDIEDEDELEDLPRQEEDDVPELIEVEPVSKKILAEERRKMGNDHFKKGEYIQALGMYTKAIELVPSEASYYGNRAASYMMLKKHQEAFSDTKISLQLDQNYDKGYLRLVRTTLALGDVIACQNAITNVEQKGGLRLDLTEEKRKLTQLQQFLGEMESSRLKKDFRKIVYLCERALDIAVGDTKLKIAKADALTQLNRFVEAGEVCTEVLQADCHCVEAICIWAVCLYQADNLDKCIQFLKQGLTFAPDNSRCLSLYRKIKQIKDQRECAAVLYRSGKYVEAKSLYLECTQTVKNEDFKNVCIESELAFNLALILQKQGEPEESLRHCNRAIELNPSYIKAFMHRANVHNSKEMFEEAVRDFESALKLDPTKRELKYKIQNAKAAAKRAKRKDYYKILHVDKNASDDDIRKAYKKRALMHHPDRHARAAEDIQKEQEKQFKDVGEAYEVLSDPKKRIRYDQGHDLNDNAGGGSDPYEANQSFNIFSMFSGGVPIPGGGARYHQFNGGRFGAGVECLVAELWKS